MYIALAGFGIAAYFTRAVSRRVIGAVAGGAAFGLVWLARWKIDYVMGWWRSRFPETPEPLTLFSLPIVLLLLPCAGAAIFLLSWRVSRRFGWMGQTVFM